MERSELSPIFILPPELLSKIFILARNWSDPLVWIVVGHVCHHWREVALGCPSLWSVPVFTKPDLAQEMILRSKMVALTITLDSAWAPRTFEELGNAMAQIHRIQFIDLLLECHPQNLKTIVSPLSQPAPLLEYFILLNPTYSMDEDQFFFPTDALSDAPRLRKVEIACLNFSWESAIFRHRDLTYLRLSKNYGTSTFGQMMDALHHLPNLRLLGLNGSIPSHMTSNGNQKTLEFKFLKYLELRAEALDCIFLLRHIQYPPGAAVKLHPSSTTVEDSTTIFSLISQNLRRTQSIKAGAPRSPIIIRSARLMSSSPDGDPQITFFDEVDDTKHLYTTLSSALGPIIDICLSGYWIPGRQRSPLLTSLSNCFDLSSLQGLLLVWSFTHDEIHVIRDTFGKLPKLKFINMCQPLPQICLALTENSKDSLTERPEGTQALNPQRRKSQHYFPPVTVFPALRTLVIEEVDFSYHPEDVECFIDMLMKRSDMNAPIDKLSLIRCQGVRTWQKRLGELVVDLEVQGEVI